MNRRDFLISSFRMAMLAGLTVPALCTLARADDDDSDDDSDNDSGDDHDNDGSRSGGSGGDSSHDEDDELDAGEIRSAIRGGRAIALSRAMTLFEQNFDGRIIDVDLRRQNNRLVYRFKFRESGGRVRSVSMDARTGRFLNFFGF